MKIRHRGIIHDVKGKAPFVGALIVPVEWKLDYRDSQIDTFMRMSIKKREASDIIKRVKLNPYNKGIILGGLEWAYQVSEMLELIREANESGLQVMIDTCFEVNEFYSMVGKKVSKTQSWLSVIESVMTEVGDEGIHEHIGALTIDVLSNSSYYLKTGLAEPKFFIIQEGADSLNL